MKEEETRGWYGLLAAYVAYSGYCDRGSYLFNLSEHYPIGFRMDFKQVFTYGKTIADR